MSHDKVIIEMATATFGTTLRGNYEKGHTNFCGFNIIFN
jgi:hypothetical protein